jgi:hypothetical protein
MAERYSWEIRTKDNPYSGTEGQVTLILHGANGVTEPLQLETSDFRMGALARGEIETDEDLGNLVSGNLTAELDSQRPWDIDFVRVTRLRDGKAWIALEVGSCTEKGCPLLRFEAVSPYPRTILALPESGGESEGPTDSEERVESTEPAGQPAPAEDGQGRVAPPDIGFLARRVKLDLEDLQGVGSTRQAALSKRIAELVQPLLRALVQNDGITDDEVTTPKSVLVELFASRSGANVQLKTVLSTFGGRPALAAGARVLVTRNGEEGFGLTRASADSLRPYRFAYKGQSFDVVALDGFTAKRVPVELLVGLFGDDWPEIILREDNAPTAAQ